MKLIITFFLNLFFIAAYAQLQYSVNLNDIKSDELIVSLETPTINTDTIIFYFPKTIPGTYEEFDYGRYIRDFKAYNKNNQLLEVKIVDINSFLITDAKSLSRIKYIVEDTFDKKVKKDVKVFEPAGTGFGAEQYFVINPGGLFGCFEKMENSKFIIDFTTTKSLKGYSSLDKKKSDNQTQFKAINYHELIDNPILFTNQKVEQFEVENCTVTIAAYANNPAAATLIRKEVAPLFKAIGDFTGPLPVKKYNILLFISDELVAGKALSTGKLKLSNIFKLLRLLGQGYGALEHGTSSLYFLPDMGEEIPYLDEMHYLEMLKEVVIHEFMHIYTPLYLHSRLIGDFDYRNPKMSKHLWLYEGVTEYFSDQIQLQGHLSSIHSILEDNIRNKIIWAKDYPDKIPFTMMSENIFDEPYKELFGHVYDRGAIMGMLLDFEIMRLTEGKQTLKSVVLELSKKYGPTRSFEEEEIIPEFVQLVHPDLQIFFDKYITGTSPLDLKAGFETIGIDYAASKEMLVPYNILSKENGVKLRLLSNWTNIKHIKRVKRNDIVGFKRGDVVNPKDFRESYRNELGDYHIDGTMVTIPVLRKNKKINLTFPLRLVTKKIKEVIEIKENKTSMQQKLFDIWIGK